MKRLIFLIVLCLLAIVGFSSVTHSEEQAEPIVIRFSHVVSENSPKGIGVQMFKKLVEQRLPGKVEVKIYPRSIKFTDEQALVGLLLGDVEMVAPSFPKFYRYSKALQVYDIPFMFEDVSEVHKFQQSDAGAKLLSSMEPLGIKGLRYWDNGMRVMSANKPIRSPQDLKGLSFRIESSHVFHMQYATLGALPTVLSYKELPDALKIGVVDGYENSWSNIYASKLYLLRDNYTEVGHSFLGYMVATSVSFWEGLPQEIRSELELILDEVTVVVNRIAKEKAMTDKAALLQDGSVNVISLSEEEKQEWKDLLSPLLAKFTDEIGPEMILAAQQAKFSK